MAKLNWKNKKKSAGISLIEVILAVALFGLFATALIGLLMVTYGSDVQAAEKQEAAIYLQEGLDATMAIRRQAWILLANGDHGLSKSNGYWEFSGTSDLIDQRFTRVVTIADACRDVNGSLIDCSAGGSLDIYSKKITIKVLHTAITGVENSTQATGYLTAWQSKTWLQTDWSGGSGQTIWSASNKYQLDDGNIDFSNSGSIQLAGFGSGGCGSKIWPFTTASNYIYDNNKVSVEGGFAQLVDQGGSGGGSGSLVNQDFSANADSWTYLDWSQGGGDPDVTGAYQPSGGNPGGWVNIDIPASKNSQVGGFWQQAFTTAVNNPTVVVNFDWQVTQYNPSPISFRVYLFIDSATGEPTLGTQVWDSGEISGSQGWASQINLDASSKVTAAGTYYIKVAVWVETPGGKNNVGPFTIGFDNVSLNWSGGSSGSSYPTDGPDISPNDVLSVNTIDAWSSFSEVANKNGGEIYYQLSPDGNSWFWWDGAGWSAASTGQYNTAATINTYISQFPIAAKSIVFKAFLVSDGTQQIQLDQVKISCEQYYDWPFTTASNYIYDSDKIEVAGGVAQLVGQTGPGASGSTSNSSLDASSSGWAYSDWDQGGGEVDVTGTWHNTAGNPGGWLDVNIPAGKSDQVGGFWQQIFTTTASNPTAAVNLDWQVSQYNPTPINFKVYVFVDSTPGAPTLGTEVWSSNQITSTQGWTSQINLNATGKLTTAGTYYLKIAVWIETPGGKNDTGPFTVGFDNILLNWSGAGGSSYPTDGPDISPMTYFTGGNIEQWTSFKETAVKNGGEIYYQLSQDGSQWYYLPGNGTNWVPAGFAGDYNTASVVNNAIGNFPTSTNQIIFKAFLVSDGAQQVALNNVRVGWGQSTGSGYAPNGYFESSALDTGTNSSYTAIAWDQEVSSCTPNCQIKVQLRSAPDSSGSPGAWTGWFGSGGLGTYFTSPLDTLIPEGLNFNQWVQYRVELTGDGSDTPILNEVRLNYLP